MNPDRRRFRRQSRTRRWPAIKPALRARRSQRRESDLVNGHLRNQKRKTSPPISSPAMCIPTAFLFAGVATMTAFLHGRGITKLWFKDPRQWAIPDAIAFIAVAGLLVGAALAVFVILPRLGGAARGIVFWNAITLFENGKEYAAHVQKCDPAELAAAKLEHCHELARVCRRKYRIVAWALWCGSIGLVASVAYLALY